MASTVEICNRALQKLGAKRIQSLLDDSVNARACNFAYDSIRLAELRAHPWGCAVKRVSLAEDVTPPAFGKSKSFTLPSDYVRLLPPDPEFNYNHLDWEIEQNKILTHDSAPLNIRYIFDLNDPNVMDALFREALACKIAYELCEEITQSNTKKADLKADYVTTVREARRINAILKVAQQPPEDEWVTIRS